MVKAAALVAVGAEAAVVEDMAVEAVALVEVVADLVAGAAEEDAGAAAATQPFSPCPSAASPSIMARHFPLS